MVHHPQVNGKIFIFRSCFISLQFKAKYLVNIMALTLFKQSQLDKILLGVSISFVVLFAVTLTMNWIRNPDTLEPVFVS